MSEKRRAQWTRRVSHLHALIERYLQAQRYDRANKANHAVQRVYDRWASEVFASAK